MFVKVILALFIQVSFNALIAQFPFGTSTTDETLRIIPISGRLEGGVTPSEDVQGNAGGAYHFDNGRIVVDEQFVSPETLSDGLPGLGCKNCDEFTVSAWIRPQTTTALISARPFWVVHWNSNGNLQFAVSQDGVWRTVTSKITERIENTWVHFVGVFKNGEISVYINTERAIINTGVFGHINGDSGVPYHGLMIGYDKTYGWYTGNIDDVRLYNHALSPSEVKKLYCQNKFSSDNCLKVMSWNVRNMHGSKFPMDDRYYDYERGLDVQKKLIEFRDDYDVIGLCEVWNIYWKHDYGTIYPYFYYVEIGEVSMSDGLVIMSKYPFLEKNFYSYHDTLPSNCDLSTNHRGFYNPDSITNKGFLVVKLDAPQLNNPTIVMTHTNSEDHFMDIRHYQMSAIREKINDVSGPVIIMGDLNFDLKLHEDGGTLNPTSENAFDPEYIWNRQLFNDFAFAEEYVHNKQFLPTYCPKTNTVAAQNFDEDCYKFDYMLMRNAEPLTYHILNDFCYCDSKSIPCSDHDAISSVIGIKQTSFSYTIDQAHDDYVFSKDYQLTGVDEWFPKLGDGNYGYLDIGIYTGGDGTHNPLFLYRVCGDNGGCQEYDGDFDLGKYIPGGLKAANNNWVRLALKYNIGKITNILLEYKKVDIYSQIKTVWSVYKFYGSVWQISPYDEVYKEWFEWTNPYLNSDTFYINRIEYDTIILMRRNSNVFELY